MLLLNLGLGSGVRSDGTVKERVDTGACGFVGVALMVDPLSMTTTKRMWVCQSYSWGSLWTLLLSMSSKRELIKNWLQGFLIDHKTNVAELLSVECLKVKERKRAMTEDSRYDCDPGGVQFREVRWIDGWMERWFRRWRQAQVE